MNVGTYLRMRGAATNVRWTEGHAPAPSDDGIAGAARGTETAEWNSDLFCGGHGGLPSRE